MPKDCFKLSSGEIVPRIYGAAHPGKGTVYLHGVRIKKIDDSSDLAMCYHAMANTYAYILGKEVHSEILEFDAVMSPPSSRNDTKPYREAIAPNRNVVDLSRNFTRKGSVKIGEDQTTLEQAIDELMYSPLGSEHTIKSLIIVDESIATGKTVAAVLHHLRGASLPSSCAITVAVWQKLGA